LLKTMDSPAFTYDETVIQSDREAAAAYTGVKERLKDIIKERDTIWNDLQIEMFSVQNINLTHVKAHLYKILNTLNMLKSNVDIVQSQAPVDSELYDDIITPLEEAIENVQTVYDQACEFKLEQRHWVTMESYLICRGGGVLSFLSNGQEYYDYCDALVEIIQNLTDLFIEDCQERRLKNLRKYVSYTLGADDEGYSYGQAIEALQIYKQMLSDTGGLEPLKMKSPIILELVSHAYQVEQNKK